MVLEDQMLKSRLQVLHQVDNLSNEVFAESPFQQIKMVDLDHAAKWCAEDPQCTGLCFNEETGWARMYHGPLQKGFVKLDDGTKSSVCLTLKGFGPPGTGMKGAMRPCFRSLEERSSGSWLPSKVPKDMLLLPDGSRMQLRLLPMSTSLVQSQTSFVQQGQAGTLETQLVCRTPANVLGQFL